MEIKDKAEELSKMILNSDIYNDFIKAKRKLEENPELNNRVNEYRGKNFSIQNSVADNKLEQLRNLENEYRDVLINTVTREFLNAELVLCRTIKNINEIIVSKIALDVDFMKY